MTLLQRLIVERALILAKNLEAAATSAPHGQIIDRCETLLLDQGREFLRQSLEETLRDPVETLEKKGGSREPAPAARRAVTRAARRAMMTALGRSTLLRIYFACPGCGQGGAQVDRLLGLDGFLTPQPPAWSA